MMPTNTYVLKALRERLERVKMTKNYPVSLDNRQVLALIWELDAAKARLGAIEDEIRARIRREQAQGARGVPDVDIESGS